MCNYLTWDNKNMFETDIDTQVSDFTSQAKTTMMMRKREDSTGWLNLNRFSEM